MKATARPEATPVRPSHRALAASLGKLWPHREHESSAMKNLFCRVGLHRWRQLDVQQLAVREQVDFCFWCSKIRIDGILYEP